MNTNVTTNHNKPTVLFVDDEVYVLKSLQRICRHEPYEVLTANDATQAMRILASNHVDIVVSDLRMPNIDGSQLLAHVAEQYPEMPRILLSGNADLPSVINTVNEGKLSYYFQKPWDDDALRLTLRGFIERKQLAEQQERLNVTIQTQNEDLLTLNEQLAEQAETIKQDAAMKARYFAVMSHEIRTPLNGILGALQLMDSENPSQQEREKLINTSLAAASDLNRIIDDVLDYSKLTSKKMTLEATPFDVHALISRITDLMKPAASEKGLTLNANYNSLPILIGDPVRLGQIINNLLGNAIKYTPSGSVTLNADYSDGELKIAIVDTGIGISDERKHLLFEDFQMLDDSHTRKFGGTGLGLSISKQLCEMMSGAISVESTSAAGSTFTIRVPMIEASQLDAAESDNTQQLWAHVLVVDDNEANRLLVRSMLEKRGATVEMFDSGFGLIQRIQDGDAQFDSILLDINMPEMDGYETLDVLLSDGLIAPELPVIAFTAHASNEQIEQLLKEGFHAHVSKPINIKTLIGTLSCLVAHPATNAQAHAQQATSEAESGIPSPSFDHRTCLQLVEDAGKSSLGDLVAAFGRDCTKRRTNLNALADQVDLEPLRKEAHAIAGSAAMFGASGLYQFCKEIEKNTEQLSHQNALDLIAFVDASESKIKTWYSDVIAT
jgi:signal transduction histidine kinase/HPt (histidine-containing phosphotransfer) domain-containing protein/BarA-like signal transduction histidine kinase